MMDGSAVNGLRPFKLNPPEPAESCTKCRFSLVDGPQLLCRRHPPQVTMVLAPTKLQGNLQPVALAAWPAVDGHGWCGEFTAKAKARTNIPAAGDTAAVRARYPMRCVTGASEVTVFAGDWPQSRTVDLRAHGLRIDGAVRDAYEALLADIAGVAT